MIYDHCRVVQKNASSPGQDDNCVNFQINFKNFLLMPSKRQKGSEDEGESSSFEDIFEDIEEEDTIFDPSLLEGCDTENECGNAVNKEKAIPLSSISKFSDLRIEDEAAPRQTYLPSMPLDKDSKLDVNPAAYDLFRELNVEWPCLSFDFLSTEMNDNSALSLSIVAGSQADSSIKNRLYYIKASNIKLLKKNHSPHSGYLSSSSDNSSDDEFEEQVTSLSNTKNTAPALSSVSIPHKGCVNRVRVSRAAGIPAYVASWSDIGNIYIWNSEDHLRSLDDPINSVKYSFIGEDLKKRHKGIKSNNIVPLATISNHGVSEGYGLAWSIKGAPGRILSGDCNGKILLSQLGEGCLTTLWEFSSLSCSVEDLSWSTIEAEVFASADTFGMVKIWDTRQASGPVAVIAASGSDINAISWNPLSTFLLASGADDGEWATWDLRHLHTGSTRKSSPLISFRWHQAPISSIEWNPLEPSLIMVSGSDDQLTIWDLTMEREPCIDNHPDDELPSQLLFVHQGQRDMKEAHWASIQTANAVATGVIVSTAATGFHIFKPFNI